MKPWLKILAATLIIGLVAGCVEAPIAPNLKFPEMPAKECPKLDMPPIADNVELDIKGDKINKINEGGDVLLRGYARARSLLR